MFLISISLKHRPFRVRLFDRIPGWLWTGLISFITIMYTTTSSMALESDSGFTDSSSNSITQNHYDTEEYHYSKNIILRVNHFKQAIKLFSWLDSIRLTRIGLDTLKAIEQSNHQLLIYHNDSALYSAGITGAPSTKNLINGIGEDVYIKFYLDMDYLGSNCVLGQKGHYIEYSAIQNLFHELSHARHKMNGSWKYFDSEGQAIREENIFRSQWSQFRVEELFLRNERIEDESVVLRSMLSCNA